MSKIVLLDIGVGIGRALAFAWLYWRIPVLIGIDIDSVKLSKC